MKKKITLILFLLLAIFFFNIKVKAENSKNLVNIYFFHSNTCSHCKEEEKLLKELEEKYDNIKIYRYEMHDYKTQEILQKVNTIYNLKTNSVPLTIIGNKVYSGFSTSKSNLKFIKTIEYFSRHGYTDKLGEYLKLELPKYKINNNDISLEDFIDTYYNYNLLGLKTDNLDTGSIAIILGILSSINYLNLLTTIILLIILTKVKNKRNKIIFIGIYLLIKISLLLTNLIHNYNLTIISYIILSLLIIYSIIKAIKIKQEYIYLIIISMVTFIITNLNLYLDKNINIFKNILNLHNLYGINKLSYYSNYIIIFFLINLIVIWIIYMIIEQLQSLKIKVNN